MDHRLFAVLAIICLALGGTGCASKSQIEAREEILMPQQTGSRLNRRVMVASETATKKSKKKKESKRTTAKPTPKPKAEPTPEPTPEVQDESTTPDRFR